MRILIRVVLVITAIAAGTGVFVPDPVELPASATGLHRQSEPNDIRIPDPDSAMTNFHGYLWPTDASRKITSSFAEYRSLHFHGGIDISTNGSVGHRVFAVQDGYLLRIRITPNGYGKMLYVRHPDGFVSTYAHLQSFDPKIELLASAEQARTGQYEIDLLYSRPEHLVRKGDVIAYTGDTGFGPPHLHFEIRDTNLNPINPLLGDAFRQVDRIAPNIYRLLVRPLTARSGVNDQEQPRIFSRFSRKNGAYRVREKIRIRGEVGFAVETVDRSDGVGGRKGVHMLDFVLDGNTIFHAELNAIPILRTMQIYLHYDYPMILGGKGRFQKLYVERGNSLPFYSKIGENQGIVHTGALAEGEHEFSIFCTDIYGNRSELSGTLVVLHPPEMRLAGITKETVSVINLSGSPIDQIRVMGKKHTSTKWDEHTFRSGMLSSIGDSITATVQTGRYDILRILARTPKGSWSDPILHTIRKHSGPRQKVVIEHSLIGDDLKISVSTSGVFTTPPLVVVTDGGRAGIVPMTPEGSSVSSGYYRLADEHSETRTIRALAEVNGHEVQSEARIDLFTIPPDRAGKITWAHPPFSVAYDSGAVFRPLHFTVSTNSVGGRTVYSFEPRDVLLNGGVRIFLPASAGGETDRQRLYFRTNQRWNLLAPGTEDAPGTVSGLLTSTLGEVVLMEDNTPPTLGLLRVRVNDRRPSFSFRYYDNLSGNDLNRSTVTINDSLIVPEYDGEHRRARYTATGQLPRGRHLLRFVMSDRVGNVATTERWFNVR